MPIYSVAQSSTNGTLDQPVHTLITSASKPARLLETGLSLQATSGATKIYGLGRPAANGVTPTTPKTCVAENPADQAALSTSAIAWTTFPTTPAQFFRRVAMAGSVGNGIGMEWAFPRGIVIPVSSNFVIQNQGVTAVTTIASYFVIEE